MITVAAIAAAAIYAATCVAALLMLMRGGERPDVWTIIAAAFWPFVLYLAWLHPFDDEMYRKEDDL